MADKNGIYGLGFDNEYHALKALAKAEERFGTAQQIKEVRERNGQVIAFLSTEEGKDAFTQIVASAKKAEAEIVAKNAAEAEDETARIEMPDNAISSGE